jgi:hypothetical protein
MTETWVKCHFVPLVTTRSERPFSHNSMFGHCGQSLHEASKASSVTGNIFKSPRKGPRHFEDSELQTGVVRFLLVRYTLTGKNMPIDNKNTQWQ